MKTNEEQQAEIDAILAKAKAEEDAAAAARHPIEQARRSCRAGWLGTDDEFQRWWNSTGKAQENAKIMQAARDNFAALVRQM